MVVRKRGAAQQLRSNDHICFINSKNLLKIKINCFPNDSSPSVGQQLPTPANHQLSNIAGKPLTYPLGKWIRFNTPINDLLSNPTGTPIAIETCIRIMRDNINVVPDLLRSPSGTRVYNSIIDEMNERDANAPNFVNPRDASLFIKEFLKYLPDQLLPPSINHGLHHIMTLDSIVNELLALSPSHLKLFVYIFKFLDEYLKRMKHSGYGQDQQQESFVDIELNEIATCMVPWMFRSLDDREQDKYIFKIVLGRFDSIFTKLCNMRKDLNLENVYVFD